ncbi:MAG TPA: 1-acyl-sn-glycerol-3-phosphate acyltransferase [Cyclobacteriaceae bacterium]|nr:1-acyl-sn-glycerol-3-phosphate acyltransferase [Cyclobacteriaceae bacterium]
MDRLFIAIYNYFIGRKAVFYLLFFGLFALVTLGAIKIDLEEDVSKFFPKDKKVEKLNEIFQNSKFMEKLIVMVSLKDSLQEPQPDSLITYTEELVATIETELKPYISKVSYKVDDEIALKMFGTLYDHLPVFLDESDYAEIDSLIQPGNIKATLENDYHQLVSPAGIVLKRMIAKDPVGISMLAVKKLKGLQFDENFELYDNYIVTKDHRRLLFFMVPSYPSNDTGHNSKMVSKLDELLKKQSEKHSAVQSLYFGAAAVAAGNATQLRKDTILTMSLMMVLLIVFLFGFLRKKRAPFIILIPVLFGGLFALSCVYLIQGSISVIAIGAGAVILGIAVNYSLHFLAHLRHTSSIREVIKDLAQPMTIGSTTTVLAFFCLQFANAGVLRDLGLFAGFSLIGAALCSLIFLPHLVKDDFFGVVNHDTWVDRLAKKKFETNRYLVLFIFILTPVLFYFAQQVEFNSDMNSLNFMNTEMKHAQDELNAINKFSLSSVYIVTDGENMQEALRNNENINPVLSKLKREAVISKISSVSSFIVSDSLQQLRINKWNSYWDKTKRETLLASLRSEGAKMKFSPVIFSNFDSLLTKNYKPATAEDLNGIRTQFFDDYINEKNDKASIVTLVKVDPKQKERLYSELQPYSHVHGLDKQMLTNMFVKFVNADFNFIVTFTSLLVFFALLIAYGRIELTLITFVPMLITWIWILGIMALVGIEFNIVNVMVSTFIFGLGDDYSIFIMDGLQQEYKTGKESLSSIKTSIFLSAITTISGLGVLIFAQHPALKSIAAISIIGIVCVFIMSQTIEPFLFRLMISGPASRGETPRTAWGTLKSTIPYAYFTFGAFVFTIIGFVMFRLWPFKSERMKVAYHYLLCKFTGFIFPLSFSGKKKIINNGDFEKPAIIVANHQSILDILSTVSLTPKILLVTNQWVWNSPVFGFVVRLAEYYPVTEGGGTEHIDKMRERLEQGYSILIFPEGTRTSDRKLKRFHKGAFYMAEQLGADIRPLLIHGSGNLIPKGELYVDKGIMTLKFLPRIAANNTQFGTTYSERTKQISKYFKQEYASLAAELETPAYFRRKLISNYLFKGPVLEWYMRVKVSLEKNYEPFEKLIPKQATVLDLGCGYGFLCYMLHFLSADREITGVDYDEEKIATANHCYSRNEKINFFHSDITLYEIDKKYDIIIIADVLHYLTPEQQILMLQKAFASVTPGGAVIVREGNKDMAERHKGTQLSEFFSVKVLGFNKSQNDLNFMSGETIRHEADKFGLDVEIVDDTKFTSNVIFVIRNTRNGS